MLRIFKQIKPRHKVVEELLEMFLSRPPVGFFKSVSCTAQPVWSCNHAGLTLHRLISNCSKELCSKPLVMSLEELMWKLMWIKSNQNFSQLLLLFSSGWHSRIQPGHHEIWKGLLFTRDYPYEWAGTAKKFHSCLQNKLRLSVPAQHLEKVLPSKKGFGAFVFWRVFFLSFCFGSLVGAGHASLHVYLHGSVSLLCQAKKLRFCCCCRFDFFDSLGSMPWHATVVVPRSSRCVYDLRGGNFWPSTRHGQHH